MVGFQWGYCANPLGGSVPGYEVGEPLVWRLDRSGRAPAWSYFKHTAAGNIGDPAYADVLLRESEFATTACPECGHRFAGIGVLVRAGIIQEVRLFEQGLADCDCSVIESDGSFTPKPEWDNYPMPGAADGGWFARFATHPELLARK
jgi:hypothetical protein